VLNVNNSYNKSLVLMNYLVQIYDINNEHYMDMNVVVVDDKMFD